MNETAPLQGGAGAERSGPGAERSGPGAERSGPGAERSGPSAEPSGLDAERSGPGGILAWACATLALAGGLVLLGISFLTVVSGTLRSITSQPVRGDFELVSIGSGLGVLAALAYTGLKQGHILVDSFTTFLPARFNRVIDAFWHVVWALVMGVIAWRMTLGGIEAMGNGSRTIGLLALPYGWAIAVGALCFGLAALVALAWVPKLLRR